MSKTNIINWQMDKIYNFPEKLSCLVCPIKKDMMSTVWKMCFDAVTIIFATNNTKMFFRIKV